MQYYIMPLAEIPLTHWPKALLSDTLREENANVACSAGPQEHVRSGPFKLPCPLRVDSACSPSYAWHARAANERNDPVLALLRSETADNNAIY